MQECYNSRASGPVCLTFFTGGFPARKLVLFVLLSATWYYVVTSECGRTSLVHAVERRRVPYALGSRSGREDDEALLLRLRGSVCYIFQRDQ